MQACASSSAISVVNGESAFLFLSPPKGFAPLSRVLSSPEKFRAELADPGIARRSHLTELAAVDIAIGVGELDMVEDVEEFRSDLKPHGLSNNGSFGKSKVGVAKSGTVEKLAAGIAELTERTGCKRVA